MAHIDWQTPPYAGRRIQSTVPATGTYAVQHNGQVIALHEGRVSITSPQAGQHLAAGIYHSNYEFQVQGDDPADTGPWALTINSSVIASVVTGIRSPGNSFGTLGLLVVIRQLSDGAIIYVNFLRDRKRGRRIFGAHLHDTNADAITVNAGEYRLDLFSYASIMVRQPRWAWPNTFGLLDLSALGAGANVSLTIF